MTTLFETKDFDVFTVQGLEDRMNALYRPSFFMFSHGSDVKKN